MIIVKYFANFGEVFFSMGDNVEECLDELYNITGELPNINNCRFFDVTEFFVEQKFIRK